MKETIISVTRINKSFGPTKALKEAYFDLEKGDVHGLIGENGSGKSTRVFDTYKIIKHSIRLEKPIFFCQI